MFLLPVYIFEFEINIILQKLSNYLPHLAEEKFLQNLLFFGVRKPNYLEHQDILYSSEIWNVSLFYSTLAKVSAYWNSDVLL